MSRIDLDAVEARARAATAEGYGGEWGWDGGTLVDDDHDEAVGISRDRAAPTAVAAHIASMDPTTTLAMAAELRALYAENEQLQQDLDTARQANDELDAVDARRDNERLREAVRTATQHLRRLPWTPDGCDLSDVTQWDAQQVIEGVADALDPWVETPTLSPGAAPRPPLASGDPDAGTGEERRGPRVAHPGPTSPVTASNRRDAGRAAGDPPEGSRR